MCGPGGQPLTVKSEDGPAYALNTQNPYSLQWRYLMSAKDMSWALTRKTRHAYDKLILAIIAECARDGWTFISQATLAKRAVISRRSVNSSLGRLCEDRFIKRVERWNGNVRTSDHIQILAPSRCNSRAQPPMQESYSIPSSPYGVGEGSIKGPSQSLKLVGGTEA